jgi:hypothetical protein
MRPEPQVAQIERVIRDWLAEPAITLVCGDWRRGSIMELYPEGRAELSAARYDEPFSGLRDLRLVGQGHHLHLDLAKLSTAVYTVAPSVCYGYRPSFEVRFTAELEGAGASGFTLCVRDPYRGERTNRAALVGYFRRMLEHQSLFPLVIRFHVDAGAEVRRRQGSVWRDAHACLVEAGEQAATPASLLGHAAPFARAAEGLLRQGCDD